MIYPFEYGGIRLTSPYGERALEGTSGFHGGIDLVGLETDRVVSTVSGTVAASACITDKSDATWMWGEHIIIAGDDGRVYFYFHLDKRLVARYERVEAGQVIGVMGNTGFSFGAHLHFEIRESDAATRINAAEALGIPNMEGCYEPKGEKSMKDQDIIDAYLRYVDRNTGDTCDAWARDYTDWARACGLFKSDGDGNFRWQAPISRQELCAVLYRFYRMMENGSTAARD